VQSPPSSESFASEAQAEECRSFILRQLELKMKPAGVRKAPPPGPAIAISRRTGSGAHEIAEQTARLLQEAEPKRSIPWTVFDRQLVEKVLEEHHLPQALARFMPEDRRSFIQDVMEELVGLRPPSWVMVPRIAKTVLHLATMGRVILVGRGANFITARMPNVFHVRLIASVPTRIERLQKQNGLTPEESASFVRNEDRAAGRYLKSHFRVSIEDDTHYHLVINTDRIPCADAAALIAEGARRSFQGVFGGSK